MIECETTLKNWGNSLGVIIPKNKIKKEGLHAKQKVRLFLSPIKTVKVKDIFGKSKIKSKNLQKELEEIDKELDSKF